MGKTLPIMRTFFLSLLPVLFLVSCEDSFGIESSFGVETDITVKMGTTSYSPQEQELLIEAVRSRLQVADIVLYNGIYFIELHGGQTAHMDGKVFPFLSSEEAKTWSLNGKDLGIPVQFDEEGKVILPALIPGSDEVWTVDGVETAVSATPYRTFATDAAPLHLTALAKFKDRLFMYGSDGEIRSLPIVTNPLERVPDYWMETLVGKEIQAEAAITAMDGEGVSFVFFSDTHWGKNAKKSPALIRHIIDFTPVDDVIFGGDVITTHSSSQEEAMKIGQDFQEAFRFLGTRFHCLVGNHDNNSDGQPKAPERHLSDDQVYSWLQSQITDVVRGGPFNYYYDNPEEKTRIICLDTGRYYLSMFRDKLPDTVRFAVESLGSLPEGWHAIIASHIWCSSRFGANRTVQQYLEAFVKPILRVFDAYNARMAGRYTQSGADIPYDFTQSGGKIEFCIGGHTHHDHLTHSDGGIPIILARCDASSNSASWGTNQEQSVNMVVADFTNKRLTIHTVGRGEDRTIDL
jgi:UDP-2,3-diacylglucosamine pyrophosphatase LpxH